jgi:hypothetical protein
MARSRRSGSGFWLCAVIAATLTLTGCSAARPSAWPSGSSASADYLYLKAGVPVETRQGTYLPQRNETWVHQSVVLEKDETIINLMQALKRYQVGADLK